MPRNRIRVAYDAAVIAELAAAARRIEALLEGRTVSLEAADRRGGLRMGDRSETFCRHTLSLLANNRDLVPASFGLDESLARLATLDAVRPLRERLQQLAGRLADTEYALGAELMDAATDGYALLKVAGAGQGLSEQVRELGSHFARPSRRREPAKA